MYLDDLWTQVEQPGLSETAGADPGRGALSMRPAQKKAESRMRIFDGQTLQKWQTQK